MARAAVASSLSADDAALLEAILDILQVPDKGGPQAIEAIRAVTSWYRRLRQDADTMPTVRQTKNRLARISKLADGLVDELSTLPWVVTERLASRDLIFGISALSKDGDLATADVIRGLSNASRIVARSLQIRGGPGGTFRKSHHPTGACLAATCCELALQYRPTLLADKDSLNDMVGLMHELAIGRPDGKGEGLAKHTKAVVRTYRQILDDARAILGREDKPAGWHALSVARMKHIGSDPLFLARGFLAITIGQGRNSR